VIWNNAQKNYAEDFMNPKSKLPAEKCSALLERAAVGTLATVNADGSPYAVPVHFVEECGKIYVHSGFQGQKLANIKHDSRVSFTAWEMYGYTHGDNPEPCKTGTNYESVIISGTANIVDSPVRKREILRLIAKKYAPEKDADNMPDAAIARTCVIEIVGEISGKVKSLN
jgi:nitroimidazol reductase NimA-like FMN-containing flavoprotein (pyridoxamine 5'-phosphate oxidase superfamily)